MIVLNNIVNNNNMHCQNCGSKIDETYNFCGNCGEKIIKNKIASVPTQLDKIRVDNTNSAKRGTNVKTIKNIATVLYLLSFMIEVVRVFSLANDAVSLNENLKTEDFKYVPLYFIFLSLSYFEIIFAKDKTLLEYRPLYKFSRMLFFILSLAQLVIFLSSLLFFENIIFLNI